jgi:hypothetical protein
MDVGTYFPSILNQFCQNLITTCDLCFFDFAVALLVLLECLCIVCFVKIHIVFLGVSDSFRTSRICTCLSF